MKCQRIKENFPAYLTDELESAERELLQNHLTECEACRVELEDLSALWTKLGVLPDEVPSENLRSRFYTMLESYKLNLDEQKTEPRLQKMFIGWLERWWPRHPGFQFAAILLVLVIGLAAGYMLRSNGHYSAENATLQQELQSMRGTLATSLLDNRSPTQRIRGINISYSLEQPGSELLDRLLFALNHDPNVNVRLAAIDALYLFHEDTRVKNGLTAAITEQTSPLVQVALIDLMVSIQERRAADALRVLIQAADLNPTVKQRAEQGLEKLF